MPPLHAKPLFALRLLIGPRPERLGSIAQILQNMHLVGTDRELVAAEALHELRPDPGAHVEDAVDMGLTAQPCQGSQRPHPLARRLRVFRHRQVHVNPPLFAVLLRGMDDNHAHLAMGLLARTDGQPARRGQLLGLLRRGSMQRADRRTPTIGGDNQAIDTLSRRLPVEIVYRVVPSELEKRFGIASDVIGHALDLAYVDRLAVLLLHLFDRLVEANAGTERDDVPFDAPRHQTLMQAQPLSYGSTPALARSAVEVRAGYGQRQAVNQNRSDGGRALASVITDRAARCTLFSQISPASDDSVPEADAHLPDHLTDELFDAVESQALLVRQELEPDTEQRVDHGHDDVDKERAGHG
jgi:hypothetical protein